MASASSPVFQPNHRLPPAERFLSFATPQGSRQSSQKQLRTSDQPATPLTPSTTPRHEQTPASKTLPSLAWRPFYSLSLSLSLSLSRCLYLDNPLSLYTSLLLLQLSSLFISLTLYQPNCNPSPGILWRWVQLQRGLPKWLSLYCCRAFEVFRLVNRDCITSTIRNYFLFGLISNKNFEKLFAHFLKKI